MVGGTKELNVDNIPILGRWDKLPTPQAKDLFHDIWNNFLNVQNIQEIIEALANTKRKIRYREIGYYLRVIHPVLLKEILKSYITHGLMPQSEMPQLPEELPVPAYLASILLTLTLAEKAKTEKELHSAFSSNEMMDNNERVKQQYNSRTISTGILGTNNQLVIFDFPKEYVKQLERLLWPKWYTACFSKSCHNSSVWAKYGDNHKGACLIFEDVVADKPGSLELSQVAGGGSRTMPFYEVRYTDKPGEIDFFRSIGSLSKSSLMKLWYTDQDGNVSECAAHIDSDGAKGTWQKSYWDNFFRDITIKTRDWAYEQESRLILGHGLIEFSGKKDRILTYKFESLKGIIFGIRTPDEDKLEIINIIEKKCRENNLTDFKFFQAYYSSDSGDIRKYEIQLQ